MRSKLFKKLSSAFSRCVYCLLISSFMLFKITSFQNERSNNHSFVRMYEYSCIFPCVISIQQLHSPLSTYCFSEQLICSNISQRHRQLFVMSILFDTNNIFQYARMELCILVIIHTLANWKIKVLIIF